eukprot:11992858-Alexandrium_andersonii.AAC.1
MVFCRFARGALACDSGPNVTARTPIGKPTWRTHVESWREMLSQSDLGSQRSGTRSSHARALSSIVLPLLGGGCRRA